MGTVSVAEYFRNSSESTLLTFPEKTLRRELKELTEELHEVETRIAGIRAMVQGLSLIYPESVFDSETVRLLRPEPRRKRGVLTAACRSALSGACRQLTVSEICRRIDETNPEVLFGHRKAMASVMSVLRNMERHREVVRGEENGKSVWQLTARAELASEPHFRAQACFQ